MANKQDYYELLNITKNATPDEIKKAYRKMAMECHPDRNPDNKESEEKFKTINEAYEVLSDPHKKATYDQFGHAGLGQSGQGFQQGGYSDFSDFNEVFGDIFTNFFGGASASGRSKSRSQRGADLRVDIKISFEEAFVGIEKKIEINHLKNCKTCNGSGARDVNSIKTCPSCQGTGQIRKSQGFITINSACSRCGGRGKVIADLCSNCKGNGKISELSDIAVKIPAGVDTGSKIRIYDQGDAGSYGGPNGDLYIVIHVKDHPIFKRQESDVYCEVPISFVQAALGTDIEIPNLDGKTLLKIPAGTQNGKAFRLKSKGFPLLNGYGRGDQTVRILIETPTKLSSKQKDLLKEFSKLDEEQFNHPISKNFFDNVKEIFKK